MYRSPKTAEAIEHAIEAASSNGSDDVAQRLIAILQQLQPGRQAGNQLLGLNNS